MAKPKASTRMKTKMLMLISRIHFGIKTGKYKSKNTKRQEGVECHTISHFLSKRGQDGWILATFSLSVFMDRDRLGP